MIRTVFVKGRPYSEIFETQKKAFEERVALRKNGSSLPEDLIIFAEHNPVYTLGKHGNISNLLLSIDQLNERGVEFVKLERGGDITYHGPGQLTVYPIIDLLRYGLGVKEYVELLEEAVIRTISRYGIRGERIEGATGVWIGKGERNERKISAIGIKCSRYISMHGLALNVGRNLEGFSGINPCGFKSKGVTSISIETGEDVPLIEVKDLLEKELISLLQLRIPSPENS